MKNTPTKFKLRSGNVTPFKQMGGGKDIDAYNTTVRAQYEAQLQSHSDSTSSYNMELEKNKLLTSSNRRYSKGYIHPENITDRKELFNDYMAIEEKQKALGYSIPNNLTDYEKKQKVIYGYSESNRRKELGDFKVSSTGKTKNPNSLRPKKKPVEPMYKAPSIGAKEISTTPPLEGPLEVSKRRYITSKDGKTKVNLKTGEKTKVKTSKVKKTKKPGKRSVKNLVTGKYNEIQ